MALLLRALSAAGCVTGVAASLLMPHHPDVKAAQGNAFALFNSIHSAMRQWGSSLNHNGMSFYLATAPAGSVFYHGDQSPGNPETLDWLAFEFEHAGNFAQSRDSRDRRRPPPPPAEKALSDKSLGEILLWHQTSHDPPPPEPVSNRFLDSTNPQRPVSITDGGGDDDKGPPRGPPGFDKASRGYLHIYRTNRPLNLLYIDGEAAAKCELGPLDSQDYILLGYSPGSGGPGWFGEFQRAKDMCALAEEWAFPGGAKIDGFIRMEAGFEIIFCDFSPAGGLDLLSVQASPFRNETGMDEEDLVRYRTDLGFEWLRAAAQRFHGQPAGRLDVDWSSMVSAYAYPVNLSNPDWERQDLPRLVNSTADGRRDIRERLREVVMSRGGRHPAEKGGVNWQGLVDQIVTRFSDRLKYLVADPPLAAGEMLTLVGSLLDYFISYPDRGSAEEERLALDRCTQHYLDPALLRPETWTPEDYAIAAAIERVSSHICSSLFSARQILRGGNNTSAHGDTEEPAKAARELIQRLNADLRWSTWKDCGGCASPDEICMVPMFPVGGKEDHSSPKCKNMTEIEQDTGYWRIGW